MCSVYLVGDDLEASAFHPKGGQYATVERLGVVVARGMLALLAAA
jgi:hypothetical protein